MKILFLVIAGEEIRTGEPQYQTMPHVSVWIFYREYCLRVFSITKTSNY